jgi:serine/threonine-protein kinase
MLTGKPPFEAEVFGQLAVQIITKPPPRLGATSVIGERIPPVLAELVMKCLEKDIARRPQSAEEIAAVLEGLITLKAPRGRSRAKLAAMSVAAVVVILALAGWALRPSSPVPTPLPEAIEPTVPVPAMVTSLEPATVRLSVVSTPPGARVIRTDTGEELGVTPLLTTLAAADRQLTLRLLATGYEPAERLASLSTSSSLEVTLAPIKAVPTPKSHKPVTKLAAAKSEGVSHDGVIDPFAP